MPCMGFDSVNSSSRSEAASWWTTLPFEFESVRVSREVRPVGFRFSKSIINIQAVMDGVTLQSCGEADLDEMATTKAIMELIERASLMGWQRQHRPGIIGTSNGWAAHETLPQAKTGAILELVERDAALAQWYLSVPFLEFPPCEWPPDISTWAEAELSISEFSSMRLLLSTEGIGPSVTCLFVNEKGFGVSGHSTKETLRGSIESAIAETCRAAHHAIRRSFWSDSEILRRRVKSVRVQPGAHAVYYAYHEPFPAWMFGPRISWVEAENSWNERIDLVLRRKIGEFTFHQALSHPAVVGFAAHDHTFELTWETTNIQKILKQAEKRNFSVSLAERNLNTQPHIVS